MTQVTIEELQLALVEERITLLQFIEVLADNFGMAKTMEIIQHNLKLAQENEKIKENKDLSK